jgi:hypothetical protein
MVEKTNLHKNNFDGILDVTIAFEKPYDVKLCKSAIPGLIQIFGNHKPLNIHIHLKKYNINDVIEPKQFIHNVWKEKEGLLDKFENQQYFNGNQISEYLEYKQYMILTYGTILYACIWCYITLYYKYITIIYGSISGLITVIMILFELYQNSARKVKID